MPSINYRRRRISDPEEGADATAQVFTNVYQALVSFRYDLNRPAASFRSWVFAIAHNVVVDSHRHRKPVVRFDHIPDPGETHRPWDMTDPALGPDEVAIQSDAARDLHRALNHLPERHRAIVELRLAGLAPAEIAVVLGMSPGNVRIMQFRAFARLRKVLDPAAPPVAGNEGVVS